MATKKQKEELMQALKFTPRRYQMLIQGYGGESYAGTVDRKVYDYFKEHLIPIDEYASDWEEKYSDVPQDMQPFSPGSPYDCDNLFHCSGAELSDSNVITVYDETGKEHWECAAGINDLEDAGVTVNESGSTEFDDLPEDTVVFWGGQGEKGCFFEGEIELRAPFDPAKLTISYENCDGWWIISGVEYDGEEIDGSGGYSTSGKWAENKWVLCNGEEVYEGISRDSDEDESSDSEQPESACDSEWDPVAELDKILVPEEDEFEGKRTDWYPASTKPERKGTYECEFETTTWPWPIERMCEWTGRSWKEQDGTPAKGIKQWRGLTEEIV